MVISIAMGADRNRAPFQTQHAIQASDLAVALNDSLKKVRVGPGEYVPELTSPEGPSTAGGIQAMQHLRLVPGQTGLPTLVVGHANHAEGKAELRSFEYVDAAHRQRYRRPLTLDRAQYDAFLEIAKLVLGSLNLRTTVAPPPANPEVEPSAPSPLSNSRRSTAVVATIVVLMVMLLAVTVWAIFFGRR